MNSTVEKFLTSLVGTKNWNPQFAQIREWAKGGQIAILLAVSAALTDEPRTLGIEAIVRHSVLDSVELTLARTPGLLQAESALKVLQERERQSDSLYHRHTQAYYQADMAAVVAEAQSAEVLEALFSQHSDAPQFFEFLTCLVQEMVLRAVSIFSAAEAFWERQAVKAGHPLSSLPLRLLPQEAAFGRFLSHSTPHGKHWATPSTAGQAIESLSPSLEVSIEWTEIAVLEEEKAYMEAAAANWEQESNGKLETRLFQADAPVTAAAITEVQVLSLPLDCLKGAGKLDLWLVPYSAADAVAVLFSAACTGGAYNRGLGGAYGRLAAWKSAGSLAGTDSGTSVEETAAQASVCAWHFFNAKSAWFYDIAWDVGLLALRPNGRTLAVLAATDTD